MKLSNEKDKQLIRNGKVERVGGKITMNSLKMDISIWCFFCQKEFQEKQVFSWRLVGG